MDIAEQKKEYEALKSLSTVLKWTGSIIAGLGLCFLPSIASKILITGGALLGFAGVSIRLFAKYRFGLIKSFNRWIMYEILIFTALAGIITFLIVPL